MFMSDFLKMVYWRLFRKTNAITKSLVKSKKALTDTK